MCQKIFQAAQATYLPNNDKIKQQNPFPLCGSVISYRVLSSNLDCLPLNIKKFLLYAYFLLQDYAL